MNLQTAYCFVLGGLRVPNRAAGGILALARGDPPPTPTLPFNAHIYTPPPPAKLPGQRRHTEHPALNGEGEERERA